MSGDDGVAKVLELTTDFDIADTAHVLIIGLHSAVDLWNAADVERVLGISV